MVNRAKIRQPGTESAGNPRAGRPSRMSGAGDLDRAMDAMLRHPAMSPVEIAALVGCSEATASKALNKLAECSAERALAGFMGRLLSRMESIEARLTILESGRATGGESTRLSRMLLTADLRHAAARPASGRPGVTGKK
jgi:hypothetical protein